MVWVEGAQYAEFFLVDESGQGHWFPCQVAGRREFGSNAEPRIIMQKGDNIKVPEKKNRQKYCAEFVTGSGSVKPQVRFIRDLLPGASHRKYRTLTPFRFRRRLVAVGLIGLFQWSILVPCLATDTQEDNAAPRYGQAEYVYFEFGLRITAKGKSTGILGTVPIPIDWPEQEITIIQEKKTDNIRKLSYKTSPVKCAKCCEGQQTSAGEVAEGSVILRAERRFIEQRWSHNSSFS